RAPPSSSRYSASGRSSSPMTITLRDGLAGPAPSALSLGLSGDGGSGVLGASAIVFDDVSASVTSDGLVVSGSGSAALASSALASAGLASAGLASTFSTPRP